MKPLLSLLIAAVTAAPAMADFQSWTNREGKSVELELSSVSGVGADQTGDFKTRAGRSVKIKASDLSEADAARLSAWKPPAQVQAAAASVFDRTLDGNLLKLEGKSLKRLDTFTKPTKYYLFYYTASWCGPCQKFTPSLVDFYNANKPGNAEFEIVLVTLDDDEKSMEGYAMDKNMPWPHLKLSKAAKFQGENKHPGRGIPNLVLTDLEGNLLKTSYEGETYLGPTSVMNHLGTLLKK